MAKTNFTKVEEILNEGLRKISVEHLLELSEAVPPLHVNEEMKDQPENAALIRSHNRLISTLQRDLKRLHRLGKDPYKKMGISKLYLKTLAESARELTDEELEKVENIKKDLIKFKEDLLKNPPITPDDTLIEQQIKAHKTKRFNIRKDWLPLS